MKKRESEKKRLVYVNCAKTIFFAIVVGLLIFYGARLAIKLADPMNGQAPNDQTDDTP